MKLTTPNIYYFILFTLFLLPYPAITTAQINSPTLLEFALTTQNQTSDFKFSNSTSYKTKTNQLGINWYEPFTHYFHAGLEVGYLEMTQADNTLASARFTSGEYAGLLLRFIPLIADKLSVVLNLNYRYSQTRGSSSGQETQFAWHTTVFSTELQYQLTSHIGLLAAAEYQSLNGEQRDLGAISNITEFTESKPQSTRFGINFSSSQNGVIGLEKMTGFKSGTRLYFLRKF